MHKKSLQGVSCENYVLVVSIWSECRFIQANPGRPSRNAQNVVVYLKRGCSKRFAMKLPDFSFEEDELELFGIPERAAMEAVMLKEAERLCIMGTLLNRVVYDLEWKQSPYHQVYSI